MANVAIGTERGVTHSNVRKQPCNLIPYITCADTRKKGTSIRDFVFGVTRGEEKIIGVSGVMTNINGIPGELYSKVAVCVYQR